jgi:DNA-directed RNA polymerase subunit E'/Rpb7
MATLKIIQRKIRIEPNLLNENLEENILNKIIKLTKNECTLEHGFIISVNRLVKIADNYISNANSDLIFNIQFEANVLKPKQDDIFSGKVCMVFINGVFIEIMNKLKVLITKSSLEKLNYILDIPNSQYVKTVTENKKVGKKTEKVEKKCTITVGDNIKVKITNIKYDKKTFLTFGELLEES